MEAVGKDFKKDITSICIKSVLTPYRELYEQKDQQTLDNIEKRYIWFNRALKDFKNKSDEIFPHYWGIQCFIVHEFCGITSVQVNQILSRLAQTDEEVISLIKALQATLKFETSAYEELKAEYEQYVQLKSEGENPHRISGIPKIRGTISKCFEEFTGPYVRKEETDLEDHVMREATKDLEKKDKATGGTEDLNLLNSSLVMFNKIKFLLDRASKISRGKTMLQIKGVIQKVVRKYLGLVQMQIGKEEQLLKKDSHDRRFIVNICVLVNTLDYVKETLSKMTEIVSGLIDEPFNQNVNFSAEEDHSAKVIVECIDVLVGAFRVRLEAILTGSMLKKQWDKVDNVILFSSYIDEIKKLMKVFCDEVRDNVAKVYTLRCFKLVAEVTTQKFLETIYKIRKINQFSVQQLQIDFNEIKQQLDANGLDKNGELISNIYPSLIEQYIEKTKNVIKLLDISPELIEDTVRNHLRSLTQPELSKILALKNLKKAEINNIMSRLNF